MIETFYLPYKPCYTVIEDKLTYVTPLEFTLVENGVKLTVKDSLDNEITIVFNDENPFYETPRDFELGNRMNLSRYNRKDVVARFVKGRRKDLSEEVIVTVPNGTMECKRTDGLSVIGSFTKTTTEDGSDGGYWKLGILEDAYTTQNEWCKYNDYTEVNSEGLDVMHLSYKTIMKPSDEQCKAINQLQEAINKCEKLGLSLVVDTDNFNIRLYNTRFVNSFHTQSSYDFDEYDEQCDEIEGLYTTVSLGLAHYYNCDYSVLVKKGAEKNNN